MVELDDGVVAVIALGSVLVLLLVVFMLVSLVVLRQKQLLCFKRSRNGRAFLLSDKNLERRRGGFKRNSELHYARKKRKKTKQPRGKRREQTKHYQSLGRAVKFPKRDPFASKYLENPMVDLDELDMDWSNPAFDEDTAQKFEAAVSIQSWYRMTRERVPFLQLKEATILAQALFRGRKARAMLPRLRKEKIQRNQMKKKYAGWKKKGTLAALKYYDVKAFGFAEVEQLYGMEIVRDAANQLKTLYGGKGKMKLKLFISVKGIKLYHVQTMEHFATVKVSTVSFCTLDPKSRKVFAFINRKKKRNFCHVFQASETDAQKMVETMAEAFEVTFRKLEQKRKDREREKEQQAKKALFDHKSQELEDEVASMMEMAETASNSAVERLNEFSSDDGSLRGSREKLLAASPERRPRSSLVTSSYRAPTTTSEPEPHPQPNRVEQLDKEKVDYFSGLKEDVDIISVSLDQDSKRASILSEKRKLVPTSGDMAARFS